MRAPNLAAPAVSLRGVPLVEVRDLRIAFRTKDGLVRAVNGVSFRIDAGEIIGVVGESGSGKTLSLLGVMGLINDPNAVIEGSVRFRGRELIGLKPRQMRELRGREIAMIFQDPMSALTPVYTIGWQIIEQLRAHTDLSRRAARDQAAALLHAVGIPTPTSTLDRYPYELSGGMRQRAFIAMALSCRPALLIADEPTTALDVTVQAQILELLARLRSEFGSAIAIVTHDLGVVAEITDRVVVMYGGRIVEEGGKRAIFSDPQHPYTWGLLDSIPPLRGPRLARLNSIPGSPPSPLARGTGCAFAQRCVFRAEVCDAEPTLQGEHMHRSACFLPPIGRAAVRAARKPARGGHEL